MADNESLIYIALIIDGFLAQVLYIFSKIKYLANKVADEIISCKCIE